MNSQDNSDNGLKYFNTLGLSGTNGTLNAKTSGTITLNGKGADISNGKALHNLSKKKTITQSIVLSLIDVAKKKEDPKMVKSLWNTYHCRSNVIRVEDRIYGNYCRSRICSICNGVRKAELIRKYLSVVQTWERPYFVTLTAKSVPAKGLYTRLRDMNRGLKLIIDKYKKRAQRGKGMRLVGVKSLECNFNPKLRTYNPHLHLVVETEEMANILKEEWLNKCTVKFANPKAQCVILIKEDEKEENLVEVIKYSTKQFTEPDPNNKGKKNASRKVYTAAMYNIHKAMKGIRVFDRFGFNLPKSSHKQGQSREQMDWEAYKYKPVLQDWVNRKNQRLTGFIPSQELMDTLTNQINSELE